MDHFAVDFLVGIALLTLAVRTDAADEERGLWKRCGNANFISLSSDIWRGSFEYAKYGINASCQWKIYVAKGYRVLLWADKLFEVEPCKGCTCDYVQFSSSSVGVLKHESKLCGTFTGDFVEMKKESWSNKYFVGFTSDGSENYNGFKVKYRAVPTGSASGCVGMFDGGSGTIKTPKYPKLYEKDTICDWTIKSDSEDSKVKLTFSSFELEKSDDCLEDYVEVRDDDWKGPLIGRYCGNQGPSSSILSSGRSLWVRFRSNGNETTVYEGFKAQYESGAVTLLVTSLPLFVLALLVSILSV